MKQKVNVIIPVKNEEQRLPACLSALRGLNYGQELLEIVVVDNGSTDKTVKIAQEFGCSVFVEPCATVAKLRNIGVATSKSDIICFVDADIIVDTDWLEQGIKYFEDDQIGCVTGLIGIPLSSSWIEKIWSLNRKTNNDVFLARWASSMNMLMPRKVFQEIGGFTEGLVTGEDVDLSEKIVRGGLVIIYDTKVQVTHVGEAKTVKQFFKKERWRGFSDLDLLLSKPFRFGNLKNAVQPLFFIAGFLFFIAGFSIGNVGLVAMSVLMVLSLPSLRALLISVKQRTPRFCIPLFAVWFIYYLSRSVAIIDNIGNRFKRLIAKLI